MFYYDGINLKRKRGRNMIIGIICGCLVINGINIALNNLEHKQDALCYDIYILRRKMEEDERNLF